MFYVLTAATCVCNDDLSRCFKEVIHMSFPKSDLQLTFKTRNMIYAIFFYQILWFLVSNAFFFSYKKHFQKKRPHGKTCNMTGNKAHMPHLLVVCDILHVFVCVLHPRV